MDRSDTIYDKIQSIYSISDKEDKKSDDKSSSKDKTKKSKDKGSKKDDGPIKIDKRIYKKGDKIVLGSITGVVEESDDKSIMIKVKNIRE